MIVAILKILMIVTIILKLYIKTHIRQPDSFHIDYIAICELFNKMLAAEFFGM